MSAIKPQAFFSSKSLIDSKKYQEISDSVDKNSDTHWAEISKRIDWIQPWKSLKKISFEKPVEIKWYIEGKLNVSANCLDRHLLNHGQKIALLCEPDHPSEKARQVTYSELHKEVSLMANVLKKMGVQKGDVVTIYLPPIAESVVAMLACARIGAIHSVIFGGFSPDSIADRMRDGNSSVVVTATEGHRGGRAIPLKKNMDEAILKLNAKVKVLLVDNSTGRKSQSAAKESFFNGERDLWWDFEKQIASEDCPVEVMDSEDPLFILYTSGSTGKPKGVLHTTGGYLTYASYTHEIIFDHKPTDIYWCTADVGWITGHSYLVYGPLSNASTVVLFEGVPNYPTVSRFWEVIDKYKVTLFYTAPTAIRALMREGDVPVQKTSRQSLRLLGSVGEPINPEAWLWYLRVIGDGRCPVVDTWWQTETGGILISAIPGANDLKPGSATKPIFGIKPEVLSAEGKVLSGACEGVLVLKDSWPGQMRTVFKDHSRFEETYFSTYKGYYFTGDGCRRDEDGYYWITGRVDDVLNVSGHRLGTAEIESAFVAHPKVAEAAVVGYPHDIKGQGIYCFVTLKLGVNPNDSLSLELKNWVAKEISPIAKPDLVQWAPSLPKTRSGKIMRRILRKIAENAPDQLGDISTLADPSVVQDLVQARLNR